MIWQARHYEDSSGIELISEVPCKVLYRDNWKWSVEEAADTIFFIDDGNVFVTTEEFADAVKRSDSYFVIVIRENLYHLPYSTDEIYGCAVPDDIVTQKGCISRCIGWVRRKLRIAFRYKYSKSGG